ncbi:hypothetical protein DENIS_0274 [Desulfonema ishimotonii]|uniref:ATPase AAA-type core domain-containing protein n=1 Tax=Desulfonema ishimotonii TaxID=45657 RepID=A0A401FQU4_9BACT|nr:ATP-binding protein [Desulfonema ishimotonii]GBC59335.1 hypothetical protein DENIS_0274 [Desulfonema ishimotonii]
MITELRLINFGTFACERIPLEPLTLFIGPPGAGKSTIASALQTLGSIITRGLAATFSPELVIFDYFLRNDAPPWEGETPVMGLGLSGRADAVTFDYDIIFHRNADSPSGFRIVYEGLKTKGGQFPCHFSSGQWFPEDFPLPTGGGNGLRALRPPERECFFRFVETAEDQTGEKLRAVMYEDLLKIRSLVRHQETYRLRPDAGRAGCPPYDGSGRQPLLEPDGANLARGIHYLQEDRRDILLHLRQWLVTYSGGDSGFVGIGATARENRVWLSFFEKDQRGENGSVPGMRYSDGGRMMTALSYIACCETGPSLAFFETPEICQPPQKMPLLFSLFETMATRRDAPCQTLIAAYSPCFIDTFRDQPGSVVLLNSGKAVRLTEIEGWEEVLSIYPPGQAWQANVFEWTGENTDAEG